MGRLSGKVAIVTGSATGIGETTARLFAQEEAKVAIVDIDVVGGEKVASEIIQAGGVAQFWEMDVRVEDRVASVFKEIYSKFGDINILINNAGVVGPDTFLHELKMEDYDYVMDTDVKGSVICAKHAIPYMLNAGGGSIVNLSSICGLIATQESPLAPYHVAKGAIQNLTRSLAVAYAKDGIRCNAVCPGTTLTPLVKAIGIEIMGSTEAYIEAMSKTHPMGRIGETIDIAYAILYLASDEAKWTTGAYLTVDGGRVAN